MNRKQFLAGILAVPLAAKSMLNDIKIKDNTLKNNEWKYILLKDNIDVLKYLNNKFNLNIKVAPMPIFEFDKIYHVKAKKIKTIIGENDFNKDVFKLLKYEDLKDYEYLYSIDITSVIYDPEDFSAIRGIILRGVEKV